MVIYMCLSFLSLLISLFILYPYIVISPLSILPVFLFFVSVLEVCILKEQQNRSIDDYHLNNTAYSLKDVDIKKIKCSRKWLQFFKKISFPTFFFFALFFNSETKCILSIFAFSLTYIFSRAFVVMENRIKNNNKLL